MAPRLEPAEAGRLLDQRASLLGLRGEDRLDLALSDDRVHALAETEVGEDLDQVETPHRCAVQEVLALSSAVQPPGDRELRVVERACAVLVVEEQLDLAEVGRTAIQPAGEEDVVRLLGAQLVRAQRPGGPADRVGDVRFPGPVRPDDHADARLEAHLDRIGKRLEATDLDRTEMHVVAGYRAGRTATRRRHRPPLFYCRARRRGVVVPGQRGVLVRRGLEVVEELEDPGLVLAPCLVLLEPGETQFRVGRPPFCHPARVPASGAAYRPSYAASPVIFASASRAASCSAAFFEPPSPTPNCSPSTSAAHVKWRSCGGPSAERTE